MIELVKSGVVFNEENHTYFLGDKQQYVLFYCAWDFIS